MKNSPFTKQDLLDLQKPESDQLERIRGMFERAKSFPKINGLNQSLITALLQVPEDQRSDIQNVLNDEGVFRLIGRRTEELRKYRKAWKADRREYHDQIWDLELPGAYRFPRIQDEDGNELKPELFIGYDQEGQPIVRVITIVKGDRSLLPLGKTFNIDDPDMPELLKKALSKIDVQRLLRRIQGFDDRPRHADQGNPDEMEAVA